VHAATSYSVVILSNATTSRASAVSDGVAVGYASMPTSHATIWNGSPTGAVDLNPIGSTSSSFATGISNGQEVGDTYDILNGVPHATQWSGSAASAVDLNPAGYLLSHGFGIYNGQEVGTADNSGVGIGHAMLWSGSAASAIDLNPAWASVSAANAIDNDQQVGMAGASEFHAVLWTGTAQSAVDLHPAGYVESFATGVSNEQQVGVGRVSVPSDAFHALLWAGTASSVIDLNPSGFSNSEALAISDGLEVGYAGSDAALWTGSAASFLNLQQFLPAQFTSSEATGIDAEGDIVGFANTGSGSQAVMWVPSTIPLPAAAWMALTTLGMMAGVFSADRRGWRKGHC
jgi:hypothetical protein